MTNLVIDLWDQSIDPYLQHCYSGALYYMFQEFAEDSNLPKFDSQEFPTMCGLTKLDFFDLLGKWAHDKYSMKVVTTFKSDRAVDTITIGFDDLTEPEVFDMFMKLFPDPET